MSVTSETKTETKKSKISRPEAAAILGVSRHVLGGLMTRGEIAYLQIPGGHPVFDREAVEAMAKRIYRPGKGE